MQFTSACFLYLGKFVIFEFKPIANINAKGQQRDGNLGNYAGIVILDIGIIAADIDYSTEHDFLPKSTDFILIMQIGKIIRRIYQ